jgi:acetyl-CoA C-acetyltransferase
MRKPKIPVLVGRAQYTQAKDDPRPLDPLGLMDGVSRKAFADAGPPGLPALCDTVFVVNVLLWTYRDAPGTLCRALGIHPKKSFYMPIGGDTPQVLVNRAARDIASGESRVVLLAGAECGCSVRRARKGEIVPDWPPQEEPERMEGSARPGTTDLEMDYELLPPACVYAVFENAIRAAKGRSIESHTRLLGRLCERLSSIAAENPFAWNPTALSASEITTPSAENRMVGYPYTILMNANIHVDQAAALVMTDEETARDLGIDPAKWVYPMGGAGLSNIWTVTRRPRLYDSPAIAEAGRLSLEQAGLSLSDISVFDLYSCYPSAIQMAQDALGLSFDDPRDISVTGGLSFFGGPGNNYSMHAICTIMDRIRKNRTEKALVSSLGWYNTKHAVGIYGAGPGAQKWHERDDGAVQRAIEAQALPEPERTAFGPFTVEAYIILHDSHGLPDRGTAIGRLADGRRALAFIDADHETIERLEGQELVGRTAQARFDAERGRNLIRF